MNDMTPMGIGHNGGPDPLDAAIATDPEALELAEGILTGAPVTSEAQMKQVDEVAKRLKALKKAVSEAEESEAKPIYDQWKSAKARFKPTLDDLDVQIKGCAAMVDAFKRKLAAEKAEAERLARAEANRKMREAEEAARQADAADLDAQREAAEAKRQADEAVAAARAASKDTVKGMRTVTRYAFEEPTEANPRGGHRMALNDIAQNDPDAITAFVEEYVRRNHKTRQIAGVRVWEEKEAF